MDERKTLELFGELDGRIWAGDPRRLARQRHAVKSLASIREILVSNRLEECGNGE